MAQDVSRTTLAVLLVLAIVVSVVGTWTVLDLAGDASVPAPSGPSADSGEVSVAIGEPTPEVTSDNTGGEVQIAII